MFDWSAYCPPGEQKLVSYLPDSANHWCGESPTDTKPVLYLSASMGTLAIEASMNHSMGLNARCLSYGYVKTKAVNFAMHVSHSYGCRIFLDSGAFTLQKQKATPKEIEAYIERYCHFLSETHGWWDWYAPVDHKRDCSVVYASIVSMQKLGAKPTPIYHGDSSMEWFERYCKEGHKLIAIGRPPKHIKLDMDYYYGHLFELAAKYNVRLHGLQETGKRMFKYPWWSCDSSSWLFGSSQGMIFHYDPKRKHFSHVYMVMSRGNSGTEHHWSTCSPQYKRQVLEFAAKFRITEEMLLKDYAQRNLYNAAVMASAVASNAHSDNSNQLWKAVL